MDWELTCLAWLTWWLAWLAGSHFVKTHAILTSRQTCEKLEIRKSQDLAKDLGGTASKAEKKICQSKIVSYIQKHNKTVIPKMETKWKEKEKKEEKKRKEAKRKRYCSGANLGPSMHRAKGLPLGHVEHTRNCVEFLLFKPLSLIKREFKDIFHKNDCSWDSENPR